MASHSPSQPSPSHASPNFAHLATPFPLLALHGAMAERYVFSAPTDALFRLRQFGEVLAQKVAAQTGLYLLPDEPQSELLRRLKDARILQGELADLFHYLRKAGNDAVHHHRGDARDALHALRFAVKLGHWYHRAFLRRTHEALPFVPPPDPDQPSSAPTDLDRALEAELVALREAHARQSGSLAEANSLAEQAYEDLELALRLAADQEARAARLEAELAQQLAALQASATAAPETATAKTDAAKAASSTFELDEAETRLLIDQQLRDAGWEADSIALSYRAMTRPEPHRNLAIAEWPTAAGPADYVLFIGLTPVAIVEAKRQNKDVAASIEQAKRYGRAYRLTGEPPAPGAPYPLAVTAAGTPQSTVIPFLFATNGRPFLRQLETKSGIWFLDDRRPKNLPRALTGWYTPAGLSALLDQDEAAAERHLQDHPHEMLARELSLRPYQLDAIAAVERALADGRRHMLLALATGTGKTRLAIGLVYRLIASGRFRRVLFLVDRTALGAQALDAFHAARLEQLRTFPEIYDVKGLSDVAPDPDTRLHVSTVQGLVRRLQAADSAAPSPASIPIDWYDCVLIDECHRGYALDQEMTGLQLEFRSEADYISKYRRVLDHFDAVKIGLTATPALHTTEIFGRPVFEYGYRQAVMDGYLVDHEPPIRLKTQLNQAGIHWKQGDEVTTFDLASGLLASYSTPDEIDIEVDGFNTKVVTEPFNRVVCDYLARELDPSLPGKVLIFCATDNHADLVVMLLSRALAERYGEVDNDTVVKITASADKPMDKLLRFKNERLPKFAVTVDLLTTGVDVREITDLVFLRRVRSRILYEQMLGRATRQTDKFIKETFRIHDAVDLYDALLPYSAMKPVVTRPQLGFCDLARELIDIAHTKNREAVRDELLVKLQARRRRLSPAQEDRLSELAGCSSQALATRLRAGSGDDAAAFFAAHPQLAPFLDALKSDGERLVLVSHHDDTLLGTERGYGQNERPDEYLAGFKRYLDTNKNAVDALLIVTQRPRDLTRKQLRELKLLLDGDGYPETALRAAWRDLTNQDIAASIIGFIRQQALGSPLLPYPQRVSMALTRVLSSRPWTQAQRRWLERIGKQLEAEVIVDRDALDQGAFKSEGGFARLDRVFDGQLAEVLATLQDEVWRDAG